MIDILKSPAEGSGGFVVLLDVADQLSGEISGRSEDPASDDIALDFGKPDLDLIKPAGIGRGVMDFEPLDWLGGTRKTFLVLCALKLSSHDVNLAALRLTGDDLAQKVDKLGAGMASGGLSHDVAVRVSSAAYSESVP